MVCIWIYICTKKYSLKIWWQDANLTYLTIFFTYTCQLQESLLSCINHWPPQSMDFFFLYVELPFFLLLFGGAIHSVSLPTITQWVLHYFSASFSLINLKISFPIVFPMINFQLIPQTRHESVVLPEIHH